jgi:endonuclease-8
VDSREPLDVKLALNAKIGAFTVAELETGDVQVTRDGRVILVHLLMWGSWHFYRPGASWDKPRSRARLIIRSGEWEAVAFSAPVIEVLQDGEPAHHPRWGGLGPDPLREDFDQAEVLRRLDRRPDREIGPAILDQTVIAGIGNILKSEILSRAGVHPKRRVGGLSADQKQAILRCSVELCERWLRQKGRRQRWRKVYRRSGRPCPQCETPIEFFRQAGRITYACPTCQPLNA